MPQIVHMQSQKKKWDEPGVPLHRHSHWNWHSGGTTQFKTTLDPTEVTCKMCLGMLAKQSEK
jgi:hypothetical protein